MNGAERCSSVARTSAKNSNRTYLATFVRGLETSARSKVSLRRTEACFFCFTSDVVKACGSSF